MARISLFYKIAADVVIMTMPDIETYTCDDQCRDQQLTDSENSLLKSGAQLIGARRC